jgi:hypothetical protein
MAEPYITRPPSGPVMELWVGVPVIWMLLVVGVIADWALAKIEASVIIRQHEKSMVRLPTLLPCSRAGEMRMEFKVVPSFVSLRLRAFVYSLVIQRASFPDKSFLNKCSEYYRANAAFQWNWETSENSGTRIARNLSQKTLELG